MAESGDAIRSQGALPCVTSRRSRAAHASRPWCPASRSMRPARAGRRHPRGSRARHPRRGPVPEGTAACRRFVAGRRGRCADRHHQPGRPSPCSTAGEKRRFAGDPQGARVPPQVRARRAAEHLRDRAPDHGLRRRRPRARPPAHRRQRRVARRRPDQARRPRPLARLVDLHRHSSAAGTATTPTRSTPCWACMPPARPACPSRQRSGPWPRLLGTQCQKNDGSWAYTPDSAAPDCQHDLRRGLQPDHQRDAALPGAGIPPGRDDRELRQGRTEPQPRARDRLAGPQLPGQARMPAAASNGSSTTFMVSNAPAGWPASATSALTTGIAWAPRSWSSARTSSPGSGRAP